MKLTNKDNTVHILVLLILRSKVEHFPDLVVQKQYISKISKVLFQLEYQFFQINILLWPSFHFEQKHKISCWSEKLIIKLKNLTKYLPFLYPSIKLSSLDLLIWSFRRYIVDLQQVCPFLCQKLKHVKTSTKKIDLKCLTTQRQVEMKKKSLFQKTK